MICGVGLEAALIAAVKMFWPLSALLLPRSTNPFTTAVPVGGNPVTAVSGNKPRFPLITVLPPVLSLVIVEPAKTA